MKLECLDVKEKMFYVLSIISSLTAKSYFSLFDLEKICTVNLNNFIQLF